MIADESVDHQLRKAITDLSASPVAPLPSGEVGDDGSKGCQWSFLYLLIQ